MDKVLRRLFRPFWRFFPVNPRKVVCFSYNGMFHADNPALVADEMLAVRPDLDVVWLVGDGGPRGRVGSCRTVPKGSWRALRELATAGVWISNMRMHHQIAKKKGQFYVQTWHGNLPLKAIEWDVADTLSPEYLADMETDNRYCDLMLSGNDFFTHLCRRAFRFDGEVLECGTPRMDSLFRRDTAKAKTLRAHYGLEPEDAVVLYAPTFRQDIGHQVYMTGFSALSAAFSRATGKRTKVLLRLHPNVQGFFKGRDWGENVVEAMDIPDIQDLYGIADCLVTDYSSSMFEFALLEKPVFLLMEDFEAYGRERKLYFRPEELPFPVAYSTSELVAAVERADGETALWREKAKAFFGRIGLHETGNATRLAAERILKEIPPPGNAGGGT